jgi:MFS family permease
MVGGSFVKNGRRRMILAFSPIGIIGCALSCIPDMSIMCVGRFVYGFTAAIMMLCGSKIVSEIVPTKLIDRGYGISTNLAATTFVALCFLLGLFAPSCEDSQKESMFWQQVFAFPILMFLALIYLFKYVHTEETLNFHVKARERENALKILRKIYPNQSSYIINLIYAKFDKALNMTTDDDNVSKLNYTQTFFGADNWRSTWLCIYISLAKGMSGVNMIAIYNHQIFEMIRDSGGKSSLAVPTQCLIVGMLNLVGAILSYFSVKMINRRPLFIFGSLAQGVAMSLIAFFIVEKDADMVLIFMSIHMIVFQCSIGGGFFIYCIEISNEFAIGISLGLLQTICATQSMTVGFIAESYGIQVVFAGLASY